MRLLISALLAFHFSISAFTEPSEIVLFDDSGAPVADYDSKVAGITEGSTLIFSGERKYHVGKLLGTGSATHVYDLNDGRVLRIATDLIHIYFNRAFLEGFRVLKDSQVPLPKVYMEESGTGEEFVVAEKIDFRFTLDDFQRRWKQTIKKMNWFRNKSYPYTLPDKNWKKKYNTKEYADFILKLRKKWGRQGKNFFHSLTLFLGQTPRRIIVYISKYGVAGAYRLPNKIYINKDIKNIQFDYTDIIKHEIIHLMTEPFIKKHHIAHTEKEKLVNEIMNLL